MSARGEGAGLPDGTRLAVVRGTPSPEEVAAVVVALDAARRRDRPSRPPRAPAWQRAAIVEAVGGRPVASPVDLPR